MKKEEVKLQDEQETEKIPSDFVEAELEDLDEPEDYERGERRRGGAFDILARFLRGVVEIGFSNNFVIRNRPGRRVDLSPEAKAATGLVNFRNMLEMFYRKGGTDGLNGVTIGRQGDGKFRHTNLIQLNVQYRSDIGSAEGQNNGWFKVRTTRDNQDPVSSQAGISVFDIGSIIEEWNGITVWLVSDGDNGGVVIAGAVNALGRPTGPRILVDKDGVQMLSLPTSNPGGSGILWRDGTTLRIT